MASTATSGERSASWQRRKDQRAPEILNAAKLLFETNGVDATSVAMIAQHAKVSEATVFKYFQNKQSLVEQVVQDWIGPRVAQLETDVGVIAGVRGRLTLIASRHLADMIRSPQLYIITVRELRWSNYQGSQLQKLIQRWTRVAVAAIEQGIADGEIRPNIDIPVVRDVFYGGLEQTGWRTALTGRPLDPEAEARKITDVVLAGISASQDNPPPSSPDLSDRVDIAIASLERIETILKRR